MPKPVELKSNILRGCFDATFSTLYSSSEAQIELQRERYAKAIDRFTEIYGADREIQLYSAPGRTEIGGNHTDHNHGVVMAAAVNLDIIAIVAKNAGTTVNVTSEGFGTPDKVDISVLTPQKQEEGRSAALIRGVAAGIQQRGGNIGGFDAYTTSDVLRGSGLSSSAAFEVCMGAILNGEYNNNRFTAVELGMIGQYAENVFFGKPSGLMDQTACAVGNAITIDFRNPAAPVVKQVPFDLEEFGHKLVITDTKGSHAGLTHEYAAIRQEMESVAACFGKTVLREVEPQTVFASIADLRQKVGDRAVLRAIHFYEECRRVEELSSSITNGDFGVFKSLILESGHSSFEYNQNAYSAQHPSEQGVSIGLAVSGLVLNGKGAWRLQGGGFAGTIQAFVPNEMLDEYLDALHAIFGNDACYVLRVRQQGAIQVQEAL